jgi:hypothetical protein
MCDERLELAAEVTIGLLTMSRNPGIDSTLFLVRIVKDLSLKYNYESVHFREGDSSMIPWGPDAVDSSLRVPASDSLGTHTQSSSCL